jgi:hypothetical protein
MADKKNGQGGTGLPQTADIMRGGKINKMGAVRQALKKLGKKAKPAAIQAHLKEELGLDMKKDLVSKYKSDILTKARKKKGAKPAATTEEKPAGAAPAKPKTAPVGRGNSQSRIRIEDILTVKDLAQRVGPEQLRSLIDAFAK